MKPRHNKLPFSRELFHAGERVCCAVSGGADSTALLLALLEANAEKESLGIVLSAVHVHHGLRGVDADGDEQFVRGLCEQFALPLTVVRVDTAARQLEEKEGLEEAARVLRYSQFRALLREGKADVIATAHTLDDQAETVMMKLLRGAWTEGLGGISPELAPAAREDKALSGEAGTPGRFVRPLLDVQRSGVEAFLRVRDQGWREDATNKDLAFTRNRIRHELMPLLRSFNPQVDTVLANLAAVARDEEAFWESETRKLLPHLVLPGKPVRGGGRAVGTNVGEKAVAIELERLRALAAAARRRILRAAARSLGVRLSFEETAKVLAAGGFGGHSAVKGTIGARLELRNGLRVERSARELRLWRQTSPSAE